MAPAAYARGARCRAGPWPFCEWCDDGVVPLICPTCQMFASDRHATLHGVVFDILVGSQSRVSPDMTADDLGHALCYHLLGSGRAGFASRRRLDRSSVLETGLTRARHEPAIGATKIHTPRRSEAKPHQLFFEHDLFGKPVPTLGSSPRACFSGSCSSGRTHRSLHKDVPVSGPVERNRVTAEAHRPTHRSA